MTERERLGLSGSPDGQSSLGRIHQIMFARIAADAGLAPDTAWRVAEECNTAANDRSVEGITDPDEFILSVLDLLDQRVDEGHRP